MSPSENSQAAPTKFIAIKDLMQRMSLCRSSVYALVRAGLLPQPIKLGFTARWVEADVEAAMVAMKSGFKGNLLSPELETTAAAK